MGLTLVTRYDSGFPTAWPVSLFGAAVNVAVATPAGVIDAASSGGQGLGFAPLGTSALGG